MDKYSQVINDPKFSELTLNTSIYSKTLEHWEKLLNYLISNASPINKTIDGNLYKLICETYDNLLFNFPFCENYHIDYALFQYKLSHLKKFHQIFDNALIQFNNRSLHLWIQYLTICNELIPDNKKLFKLYEKAESHIGLHFHSGEFWHLYLNQMLLRLPKNNKVRYLIILRKIIELPIYKFSEFYLIWLNEINQIRDLKQLIKFVPQDELLNKWKIDTHYNGRRGPLLQEAKRNLKKMTKELYMVVQFQTLELYNLFESRLAFQYYTSLGTIINNEQINVWLDYLDFVINLSHDSWVQVTFQRAIAVLAHYDLVWVKYSQWLIDYKNDTNNAQDILLKSLKFVTIKVDVLKLLYSIMINNNNLNELNIFLQMINDSFNDKIETIDDFKLFWDFIQCKLFIMSNQKEAENADSSEILKEILTKIKNRLDFGSQKKEQDTLLNYLIQLNPKDNIKLIQNEIFEYLINDCPTKEYYQQNDQFWTAYSKLIFYDSNLTYLKKRIKICEEIWKQIPKLYVEHNFTNLRAFCEEYLPEEEETLNKILNV